MQFKHSLCMVQILCAFTLHGANIVWAESDTTEGVGTMAFPGLQVPMPMTYFTHPSICAVL